MNRLQKYIACINYDTGGQNLGLLICGNLMQISGVCFCLSVHMILVSTKQVSVRRMPIVRFSRDLQRG